VLTEINTIDDCEPFLEDRNSATEQSECKFKHLCSATLNCVFSFIRLMRLDGRLLKMLMPAQYVLFLITWEVGSWSVKGVVVLCVNAVYRWISLKMFLVIYIEVDSFCTQPIFQVPGLEHTGKFGSIYMSHFKNAQKIQFSSKTWKKHTYSL
jgi:hypothetical protein